MEEENLTFNNAPINLSLGTGIKQSATLNGTLTVDYTDGTVTGTLTDSLGNTYSDFSYSAANGTYTLANQSGNLNYSLSLAYPSTNSANAPNTAPSDVTTTSTNLANLSSATTQDVPVTSTVACFATGTLIRTARGDIAVEALHVGDLAIAASGQARPIRWIGKRTLDCAAHRDPAMVRPIRIRAGAFGGGRPTRDLLLSPHHAVAVSCLGEVLVPIRLLVNGSTIVQVGDVDAITYWHVELESHDVILADGLPAESYIDIGNRGDFDGQGALTLHPEFRSESLAGYCRPLVTGGAVLAAIRRQLAELAPLAPADVTEPGFSLVVGGERIAPVIDGNQAAFFVPAGTTDLRLVSSTFSPRELDAASRDDRRLGLMIQAISIEDLFGRITEVPLDGPALIAGFHPFERGAGGAWRWTDGDALLSAVLFARSAGPRVLRLTGMFTLPPNMGERQAA